MKWNFYGEDLSTRKWGTMPTFIYHVGPSSQMETKQETISQEITKNLPKFGNAANFDSLLIVS